jgi:alkanesulfonate monooxygenase SsuD/methylene tetrahydromethanopterin reductase-like flavin-dependent oxidoreductase (luciferase family)
MLCVDDCLVLETVGLRAAARGMKITRGATRGARDDWLLHDAELITGQAVSPAWQAPLYHPIGSPPPLTRPRPPILMGGTGERRTLRLVAEYATPATCSTSPMVAAACVTSSPCWLNVCAEMGRPYEQVERTMTTALEPAEPALTPAVVGRLDPTDDRHAERVAVPFTASEFF